MSESKKDQGLSLLDIGELATDVPVANGKSLKVFGVSAKGCVSIFRRFPEVGQWFKGGIKKPDLEKLTGEVPAAMAAVIAAGCGMPGNEDAEAAAEKLPVEAQLDVLEAIFSLTFTKGFGPFVNRIVALSEQAASLSSGKASGTTSPQG